MKLSSEAVSTGATRNVVIGALVFLAAIVVFWPGLAGDFIYDDYVDIRNVDNVFIPGAWPKLFVTASAQLFRPVKYLSYYLDNQLFGWTPRGWHWQSCLWHGINAALVLVLARRFGASEVGAIVGALFFGLHPIHTEAVVWISSRGSLQSTTGVLLMLIGYDAWRTSRARSGMAALILGGVIGFLSKEDALMIFALIALYEWFLRGENLSAIMRDREVWKAILPLGAIALAYVVLRQSVLSGLKQGEHEGGLIGWITTEPVILATYLRQLIWPDPMCIDQPVDYKAGFGFAFWGGLALILLLIASLSFRKEGLRRWQFAIGFFFVTLIPVMGIIPINQARADRFVYLPSVAASLVLAWGWDKGALRPRLRVPVIAILTLWFGVFALRSFDYSKAFLNEQVLWQRVLEVNPNSFRAWANIGALHNNSGHPEEALPFVDRALAIKPEYPEGWIIKAYSLAALGRASEAEALYRKALNSVPDEPRWLFLLADLQQRQNQLAEAEKLYDRIAEVRPGYAEARVAAGALAMTMKKPDKARAHWEAALKADPNNQDARHNLEVLKRQNH
jgi:tetratricopeptide (TPR) repeat protein